MESIKLSVQTNHKFLMQASIFCRCVTNVKTLSLLFPGLLQQFMGPKTPLLLQPLNTQFVMGQDPKEPKGPVLPNPLHLHAPPRTLVRWSLPKMFVVHAPPRTLVQWTLPKMFGVHAPPRNRKWNRKWGCPGQTWSAPRRSSPRWCAGCPPCRAVGGTTRIRCWKRPRSLGRQHELSGSCGSWGGGAGGQNPHTRKFTPQSGFTQQMESVLLTCRQKFFIILGS